jgi:tRNA pseudouridine13 synthase
MITAQPLPYLTSTPGLLGELKKRIADFCVEEILPNGEVCRIEQLDKDPPQRVPITIPENPNPRKFDQLHIWMEKFNTETTFAIRNLSRGTGGSIKRIGYAGLKDKRGITCQRISLWQPNVEKLKGFMVKGMALHHATWSAQRIDLGDLRGNRFTITIRNIALSPEEIQQRMETFHGQIMHGVPNYYGEQRFGGFRNITHRVGKLLLQNKIEEGIMLYLTSPSEGEEDFARAAREHLAATRDFDAALREYPLNCHFERAMIAHLQVDPKDFLGAFRRLPPKTRYLFTHAYQSDLFNQIIAERLRRKLMYPIEGDILEGNIPTGPLVGSKTIRAKGLAGEIESAVLEKEKLSPELFWHAEIPELSSFGARKPMLLRIHDFQWNEIGEDTFNPGKQKVVVKFWLDKGVYATSALRELLKTPVQTVPAETEEE